MRFKKSIIIVVVLLMFSSAAYAYTVNYLAKYDFDGVKFVPKVSEGESDNSKGVSGITMEPVNVSDDVWLRELSKGNLEVTVGSLELTKDESASLTEGYIEVSGGKGSKILLSNSHSDNGAYIMTQYWDFKRLEDTSIVKGGNDGDVKSVILLTRKGEDYAEYFLIGYLNSDIDQWTVGIPSENYYYAKITD